MFESSIWFGIYFGEVFFRWCGYSLSLGAHDYGPQARVIEARARYSCLEIVILYGVFSQLTDISKGLKRDDFLLIMLKSQCSCFEDFFGIFVLLKSIFKLWAMYSMMFSLWKKEVFDFLSIWSKNVKDMFLFTTVENTFRDTDHNPEWNNLQMQAWMISLWWWVCNAYLCFLHGCFYRSRHGCLHP